MSSQTLSWFLMLVLPHSFGPTATSVSPTVPGIDLTVLMIFGVVEIVILGFGFMKKAFFHEKPFVTEEEFNQLDTFFGLQPKH